MIHKNVLIRFIIFFAISFSASKMMALQESLENRVDCLPPMLCFYNDKIFSTEKISSELKANNQSLQNNLFDTDRLNSNELSVKGIFIDNYFEVDKL